MANREMSLTELASRVGLTLANLSILKTNKARAIRFSTLAALCRELKCQPGDLLTFPEHELPEAEEASSPRAVVPPKSEDRSSSGLPGDYY